MLQLKTILAFYSTKKKEISKVTPKMYPDQEGRALGSLILKIHNLKDFSLSNFFTAVLQQLMITVVGFRVINILTHWTKFRIALYTAFRIP